MQSHDEYCISISVIQSLILFTISYNEWASCECARGGHIRVPGQGWTVDGDWPHVPATAAGQTSGLYYCIDVQFSLGSLMFIRISTHIKYLYFFRFVCSKSCKCQFKLPFFLRGINHKLFFISSNQSKTMCTPCIIFSDVLQRDHARVGSNARWRAGKCRI